MAAPKQIQTNDALIQLMTSSWAAADGSPTPLGVTRIAASKAYNFSIYSKHSTRVRLLLFSAADLVNPVSIYEFDQFRNRTGRIWHMSISENELRNAQYYAYSIDGPPPTGHQHEWNAFKAAKILLDPFATAAFFPPAYERNAALGTDSNAGKALLGVLPKDEPLFDWEDDVRPRHAGDLIIYEMHVRGFTANPNSGVAASERGTFAGVVEKIPYLKDLGITAVELMPVYEFDDSEPNYWGYQPINFFSPHAKYASREGGQINEFREMVKALHRAGIEVLIDVVYNHTGEGNEQGPTFSLKGIDNSTYYMDSPDPNNPYPYADYTGTGNTLHCANSAVRQLVVDSLRYWAREMHVDGFRFDLASTLARELHDVDRLGAFFDIIHQDPVLSQVKLIAEPWDLGEGGYQVGNFPVLWAEWNGEYRDTVRRFWRGDEGQAGGLGYRLTGSSDLYGKGGRRPYASINYVTAHDGFTLHDLVSYNGKHNAANGEENRDGTDENLSWNCGAEGPADDPAITGLRERQKRNFLATLLLSQGVPMVCGGDEIERTQQGNNNAYCQDNGISWYDWRLDRTRRDLLAFTRRLVALRRQHPVLRRRQFLFGRRIRGSEVKDVSWFRSDGKEMTEECWRDPHTRCLGLRLAGDAIPEMDVQGDRIADDTFLILLNAHHDPQPFLLPAHRPGVRWEVVLDSRTPDGRRRHRLMKGGEAYDLDGRCLALLRLRARP